MGTFGMGNVVEQIAEGWLVIDVEFENVGFPDGMVIEHAACLEQSDWLKPY